MVKELIHDPIFLAGKSEPATKDDLFVAQDLLDTLIAHKDSCVGMAANMTGVKKRIIAFLDESRRISTYTVMLNPEIIKKYRFLQSACIPLAPGRLTCILHISFVCKNDEMLQLQHWYLNSQAPVHLFQGT
jgi:peptide deformylase